MYIERERERERDREREGEGHAGFLPPTGGFWGPGLQLGLKAPGGAARPGPQPPFRGICKQE